jgi:hypothetical protein
MYAHVYDGCKDEKRYSWQSAAIHEILGNPIYIGHLVTGKYVSPSFKMKRVKVGADERIITENAFEPLINPDTFELVCKLKETKPANESQALK